MSSVAELWKNRNPQLRNSNFSLLQPIMVQVHISVRNFWFLLLLTADPAVGSTSFQSLCNFICLHCLPVSPLRAVIFVSQELVSHSGQFSCHCKNMNIKPSSQAYIAETGAVLYYIVS